MLAKLIRTFVRPFCIWECSCMDPQHSGDDPTCPRHSKSAIFMRIFGLLVLALVVALLRALVYG